MTRSIPFGPPTALPVAGVLAAAALAFLGLASLALAFLGAGPAAAEDQPAALRWVLDFEHGPLRTVETRSATGGTQAYHYMTMKVTNSTEYPRSWHPLVKAITDTGHTYVAGGWGHVLEAIRHRERGRELVAVGETAGRLRPGQSVDTVAVFGPLDPLYDRVEVRVHGLVDPIAVHKVEQYGDQSSEENVVLGADSVVVDSAYWDHNQAILKRLKAAAKESGGAVPRPRVEYLEVAESRYRSIRYERLGDEFFTEDDVIRFRAEAWAVEGTPGSEDGPRALRVVSTDPQ